LGNLRVMVKKIRPRASLLTPTVTVSQSVHNTGNVPTP